MSKAARNKKLEAWATKMSKRIEYWRGSPNYDLRADLFRAGEMLLDDIEDMWEPCGLCTTPANCNNFRNCERANNET